VLSSRRVIYTCGLLRKLERWLSRTVEILCLMFGWRMNHFGLCGCAKGIVRSLVAPLPCPLRLYFVFVDRMLLRVQQHLSAARRRGVTPRAWPGCRCFSRVEAFTRLQDDVKRDQAPGSNAAIAVQCAAGGSSWNSDVDGSWRPVQALKHLGDGGADPYVAASINGQVVGMGEPLHDVLDGRTSAAQVSFVPFSSPQGKKVRR